MAPRLTLLAGLLLLAAPALASRTLQQVLGPAKGRCRGPERRPGQGRPPAALCGGGARAAAAPRGASAAPGGADAKPKPKRLASALGACRATTWAMTPRPGLIRAAHPRRRAAAVPSLPEAAAALPPVRSSVLLASLPAMPVFLIVPCCSARAGLRATSGRVSGWAGRRVGGTYGLRVCSWAPRGPGACRLPSSLLTLQHCTGRCWPWPGDEIECHMCGTDYQLKGDLDTGGGALLFRLLLAGCLRQRRRLCCCISVHAAMCMVWPDGCATRSAPWRPHACAALVDSACSAPPAPPPPPPNLSDLIGDDSVKMEFGRAGLAGAIDVSASEACCRCGRCGRVLRVQRRAQCQATALSGQPSPCPAPCHRTRTSSSVWWTGPSRPR